MQSLERRVTANPRDNKAITLLADAYRKAGNAAAAWEAIQEVLGRDPSDAAAQRVAAALEKPLPAETADARRPPRRRFRSRTCVVLGEDAYRIRVADEVVPLGEEGEELRPSGRRGPPRPPRTETARAMRPVVPERRRSPLQTRRRRPRKRRPRLPGDRSGAAAGDANRKPRSGGGGTGSGEAPEMPAAADAGFRRGTVTLADVYWAQGERATARKIVERILAEDPGNERARAWMAAHGQEDPVESALGAFLDSTAKEYRV